jgi:asparagine synthase (glutamine-hydrolysing)
MCGIAGLFGLRDEARMKRMCDVMTHRGPDGEGFYFDENLSLGMRRLSIIDLTTGDQPIFNEDKSIAIIFNGEIYNFPSLYKELQAKGHRFYTHSDTEAIIHCYEEYGFDCLHHLEGMFAFALWDKNKKRLFVARDRLGVKPLYYHFKNGVLTFASEIKVILASKLVEKEINKTAVYHYLSYYNIPSPLTIIKDVHCLPPGYFLTISQESGLEIKQYWDVKFEEPQNKAGNVEEIKQNVRELVTQAVEKRLISDVPLGAFLSGGIDSSIIVGLMSRMMNSRFSGIKTFSVGFIGSADAKFDERSFAKIIAEKFKTDHKEVIVSGEDVYRYLPKLIWSMDQPSGDAIQVYFVSEVARSRVTVSLSGLGGDELFAGYNHFKIIPEILELEQSWDKLPALIRKPIGGLSTLAPKFLRNRTKHKLLLDFIASDGSFNHKYELARSIFTRKEKRRMLTHTFVGSEQLAESSEVIEAFSGKIADLDVIDKIAYLELKTYMPYMLLRDADAMSMGVSLEVRCPFTDYRLVEYVAQHVPSHLRLHNGSSKYILIDAFRDILPTEVIERKKRGFEFPMRNWLLTELRSIADDCLSRHSVERRGIFEYSEVEAIKRGYFDNYFRLPYMRVWMLVVLELWMRLYLDGEMENVNGMETKEFFLR